MENIAYLKDKIYEIQKQIEALKLTIDGIKGAIELEVNKSELDIKKIKNLLNEYSQQRDIAQKLTNENSELIAKIGLNHILNNDSVLTVMQRLKDK